MYKTMLVVSVVAVALVACGGDDPCPESTCAQEELGAVQQVQDTACRVDTCPPPEDDPDPTPPQAVLSLEVLNTASIPETCSISVTAVATGITTVLRPDTTMQPNELWTFRNVLSGNTTGYSAKVAVACAGIVREYSYWVTQTMTCRYAYWEGSTFWVSCQPG